MYSPMATSLAMCWVDHKPLLNCLGSPAMEEGLTMSDCGGHGFSVTGCRRACSSVWFRLRPW